MTIRAVYSGTFDPITKGHMDIIIRASKLFDNLIIAVAKHTGKNTIFSKEERTKLIENEINNAKLKNVSVISFDGLLVDFLKQQKASFIIRGIRNAFDFEYEFNMANMNKQLYNGVETVFLPASIDTQFISSTLVRQISTLGGDVDKFVSKDIKEKLKKKINNIE